MSRFLKNKKFLLIALSSFMLVITILLAGVAMFFMGDSQSTLNSISSSDSVQESGENSTDKLDDTLNSSGGEESSEISSDETSSDETSSDETSSDGASSDGASSDGTSSDGTSSDVASSDENSGDLTTSEVTFNVPSEMRAVYMTPGEDYFLKSDDSEETIKSQIDTALKRAQDLSMNSVVFITKLNDKTIYANSVLPSLINGFDALDYAVKKAKEMAFYTYAIYDAGDIASDDKIVNAQIIDSETIDFVTQNLQMFSKNYHFDGIIIDNYYNNSREESFNQYVKYGGGVGFKNYMLSLSKTLFQVCADTIRINSPGTQVGMMTEAVWENTAANENGSNTAASYTALGSGNSDNVQYINDKIPDFVLVKALNSTIDKTENFETVVNWWDNVMKEKDLSYYVLHASSKAATDNAGWSEYDQLIKQAMACEKLNCFNGSVFNSLQRLIADPKSSTTNLIKYYNKEINPDHVLKELAVTRPTKLQYETFEPSVTFRGASDPNTEVTINGKKIPTDQNGYFAAIYDLIPGDNVFTIDHKGKSVTYKIYRRVVIIKEFTPTGNMSVDGEMEITVSALAYADAKITATLNGKTIELVSSDRQNDDTDLNSNYKLFEGSFTVPPAKAKAQKLGNITFNGNWEGMKENKTGAAVTVNKKAEIANGRPVRVVAAQAETFSTDILNDHSNPHYYPLPSGTLDYAVGSEMIYNDGKKTFSYYKLASNLRVYTADITAVENGEGVKNNVINSTKISSDKQFTYVTIDMNQKASYVARYDGNTFTVKFNYTTKLPSSVDVGTNPMFNSSSYNGEVLTLNLAKSGGFLGYKAYYSGDNLVFRFNNPPQISGSSLEGVRISIDAGHGGIDPGAAGFLPAYPESVVNYQIAYKLYNELASRGASVQLIYTNSGELTMAKRISMAQQNNSHLLISVHANSARSAIGTEAYYFYPFSKNLAAYLSANVSNALVTTNRGAKYSYMYMTRCSQFASALIETGFLSNEKEYKKLISDGYQEEIAYAMADSITSYLKSVSTGGNYGTVTNPPVDTNTSSDSTTTPDVSDKEVEMIEFEEEKVTVGIDKSVQLKVNLPSNVKNKKIIWEVYDTNIAKINSKGVVTGLKAGETIVCATSEEADEYAECVLTVSKSTIDGSSKVTGISLDNNKITIAEGETRLIDAKVLPENAANTEILWYSIDKNVCEVDKYGEIKGINAGETTIIAETIEGGYTKKCTVTVKKNSNSKVSDIQLNIENAKIFKDQTVNLIATVYPEIVNNNKVTFKSSNSSIAVVDSNGLVKAKKAGSATITAKTSNGGKTAKCNIIVLPDSYDEIMPDEIITESELTLAINDRYELEAEIYPNDTADKEITWTVISSSSNGVIDFSTSENSAKIIALKKGKATLRAMSKYYGYIYCDCVITVE